MNWGRGDDSGSGPRRAPSTTTTARPPDHPTQTLTVLFRLPEAQLGPFPCASRPQTKPAFRTLPCPHNIPRTSRAHFRAGLLPPANGVEGIAVPFRTAD